MDNPLNGNPVSTPTAAAEAVASTMPQPAEIPAWVLATKLHVDAIVKLIEHNCLTIREQCSQFNAIAQGLHLAGQAKIDAMLDRPIGPQSPAPPMAQ